jgi:hypothetical protein
MSVCVCVCVCVCVRLYTFLHFSTDPLQTRKEHTMGHDKFGLLCVHATRAHVCFHICFDRLSPNLLGIYYKLHQLCTFHVHAPRVRAFVTARVQARVWLSVRSSLDGFSPNLVETYYRLSEVKWVISCVHEYTC